MSSSWTMARVRDVINTLPRPSAQEGPHTLDITKELIRRMNLDKALNSLKFVHVAGTKGKGSTCVYISSLLAQAQMRVGLFTSPHMIDVRERLLINSNMIDENRFSAYFEAFLESHRRALQTDEHWESFLAARNLTEMPKGGFFQFMFLLSLQVFAAEGVDIVVAEVGIGGRLDPTNVIPKPLVCGVTALGLDHMEILGNTVEEIAAEKAGIFKKGVPCFSAPQTDHPSTRRVLEDWAARKKSASLTFIESIKPQTTSDGEDDVWRTVRERGDHMVQNAQLALAMARTVLGTPLEAPLTSHESAALGKCSYAGRSQVIDTPNFMWCLDGAHTPESIKATMRWFLGRITAVTSSEDGGDVLDKPTLIFFTSRSPKLLLHEVCPTICCNFRQVVFLHCAQKSALEATEIDAVKSLAAAWEAEVAALRNEDGSLPPTVVSVTHPAKSYSDLQRLCAPRQGATKSPVLITGSFYLVGPLLSLITQRQQQRSAEANGGGPSSSEGE